MRNLFGILMLALLTTASFASAQEDAKPEDNSTRPDDAAWVEDCPPDMMCAAQAPAEEEAPSRGPADGSCEYCRGNDAEPVLYYGNDTCIECSGPAPGSGGQTCMDGTDEGEVCDEDVQYFGPPAEPVSAPAPEAEVASTEAAKAVPGPAFAVGILALAGVALLALPRRR